MRHRSTHLVLVAGMVMAMAAPPAAWPQASSPLSMQSPTPPMTAGTGAISGVVRDTDGRPAAGAVVWLGPNVRGPVGEPTRQITDSRGRYVFRNLPAFSAYTLRVEKPGYASGVYGRGNGGSRVALTDGQWFSEGDMVIARLGAITGTVTNEQGEPVVDAYVQVFRQILVGGRPQLAAGRAERTDDRGSYRIGGLSAGKYLVAIPSAQSTVPADASRFATTGMSEQSYRTSESFGTLPPAMDFIDIDQATHLLVGRYPIPPPPANGRLLTYPTVFYPSSLTIASATVIEIAQGFERHGIDVEMRPTSGARVTGVVEGPADAVGGLVLRLLPAGNEDVSAGCEVGTALVDAHGRFTLVSVPPGDYTLVGQRSLTTYTFDRASVPILTPGDTPLPPGFASDQSTSSGFADYGISTRQSSGNLSYWVRMPLTVGDVDMPNVVVRMQPAVRLTGSIAWETPTVPPRVLVYAEPATGAASLGRPQSQAVEGDPERFSIDGLMPGPYLLRLISFGVAGEIKSIRWEGRDYTYTPFDASTGRSFNDVVVTFSADTSALSGFVRSRSGASIDDAAVVLFPVEREQWVNYGPVPRRLRSVAVGTDGSYRLPNLPAGDYYVIAIDGDRINAWQDPAFLARAAQSAVRVSLVWGQPKTLDLTMTVVP